MRLRRRHPSRQRRSDGGGPIRIAVNVRTLAPGRIGGLETAFREVFGRILADPLPGLEIALLVSDWNRDSFADWSGRAEIVELAADARDADLRALLSGFDVLYCPLMFLEPEEPPIPSVVFIPDLQHETLPEHFEPDLLALRIRGLRASASRARRVVTISEFSRRQICRSFHLPESRVVVTPLDAAPSFDRPRSGRAIDAVRERHRLPGSWLLFPANAWPHKNHANIFRALAAYRRRFGEPPPLALTGAAAGGVDLEAAARSHGVGDLVRHLGWCAADDMPALYDGAACLLYVTQFEGFGIPVVEAFRRGTPVVAGRIGGVEEVAGDHALLVDPLDPDAIAEALHRVLSQPDEQRRRSAAALEWSRRFSYDRSTVETLRALYDARHVAAREPWTEPAATWPRFFVVTPSYNQGRYLRQTVDSVLAQDYPHLDYFVADGGSTDDSVEILRGYGDRVAWRSGPDGGQAAAIARAWAGSKADVVAWLNSDDWYLPGAISKAARHLLRRPDASVIYGRTWNVDARGARLGAYPTTAFDRGRLRDECFISQPATFVRREILSTVALPDERLAYCMDYDFWIRASERYRFVHVEEFLAAARLHDEAKTRRDWRRVYREVLAVSRRHFHLGSRNWTTAYLLRLLDESLVQRASDAGPAIRLRRRRALIRFLESLTCLPPYPDRWAGRRTLVPLPAAGDITVVELACESPFWPYEEPLRITALGRGGPLASRTVAERGEFTMRVSLGRDPESPADGRDLMLVANRTFVPAEHGYAPWDERPVSFLLRCAAAVP